MSDETRPPQGRGIEYWVAETEKARAALTRLKADIEVYEGLNKQRHEVIDELALERAALTRAVGLLRRATKTIGQVDRLKGAENLHAEMVRALADYDRSHPGKP